MDHFQCMAGHFYKENKQFSEFLVTDLHLVHYYK